VSNSILCALSALDCRERRQVYGGFSVRGYLVRGGRRHRRDHRRAQREARPEAGLQAPAAKRRAAQRAALRLVMRRGTGGAGTVTDVAGAYNCATAIECLPRWLPTLVAVSLGLQLLEITAIEYLPTVGRDGALRPELDPELTKRAALLSPLPVALFSAYGERVRVRQRVGCCFNGSLQPVFVL
jgi:hypothetical protein